MLNLWGLNNNDNFYTLLKLNINFNMVKLPYYLPIDEN